MSRYILIFTAVFLLLMAGLWWHVAACPMMFLHREYPMWRAKMDMAGELRGASVLIFGDSQPMAALVPRVIGPDVVNLALGGSSPVEAVALARRALVPGRTPPRAVILSYNILHFGGGVFWESGVRFGLFDEAASSAVLARARQTHDPLFGPETPGDVDARLKIFLYCHRFPPYYFSSLLNGGFCMRGADNLGVYALVRESLGQFSFGTLNGCRDLSVNTRVQAFKHSALTDSYFEELLQMLASKAVPVFFVASPTNELSAAAMKPGVVEDYAAHLRQCEKRNPGFRVLGEPFPTRPWTDYGDPDHLSAAGAARFSAHVAELLREAGVEKEALQGGQKDKSENRPLNRVKLPH